jgi:integrase
LVHAGTGIRIGEACALKAGDLRLEIKKVLMQSYSDHKIIETTKARKKRFIPLFEVACDLAVSNSQNKLPGAFLFTRGKGRGYRQEFLRRLWRKYSNIEITLYEAMRHSTITDWAESNSPYVVQDLSGHTDIRTTMHYVHLADKRLHEAVNREGKTNARSGIGPVSQIRSK